MKLRIGMMTRWNATCGVSTHAELVGREWIDMGQDLVIFAPREQNFGREWHHQRIEQGDEDFVHRCYDEDPEGFVDESVILGEDYDVFVLQGLKMLPYETLERIIPSIRRSAPIIAVLHHHEEREIEALQRLQPDVIVCFDERYVLEVVPREMRHLCEIIPFPCFKGYDVEPYRPDFAEDKILFFSFGKQPPHEHRDFVSVLRVLRRSYDLVYWVIKSYWRLPYRYDWIIEEIRRPSLREVYSYLRGADIHLLPKGRTNRVVVSSSFCSTVASLCPSVAPDTRYFETIPQDPDGAGPIVKYRDRADLRDKLIRLIEDDEFRERVRDHMRKFLESYRSDRVARMFLELFEKVLSGEWTQRKITIYGGSLGSSGYAI